MSFKNDLESVAAKRQELQHPAVLELNLGAMLIGRLALQWVGFFKGK